MSGRNTTANLAISIPITANGSVAPIGLPTWSGEVDPQKEFVSAKPNELVALYTLSGQGEAQLAVERAIALFETHLREGKFDIVDGLLAKADVARLDPVVLLGILTITFHGKAQLTKRTDFLARVEQRVRTVWEPERVERLLATRR